MFTNMLRPSRRHVHDRLSQNEADAAGSTNNGSINNNGGDNSTSEIINDQQSGSHSIAVIGGGGVENDGIVEHDLNSLNINFLEERAAATADGGDGDETTTSRPTTAGGNVDAPETSNPENQNSSRSANNGDGGSGGSFDEGEDEEGFIPLTSHLRDERERSLRYRRQTTCTLLILFFLIRLWIEAILEKDVGLIFLSMMGTTWTYRWFVTRREAEEEYDRQIAENGNNDTVLGENGLTIPAGDGEGTTATGADAAVNFDPDLGLMSFQAQLALAILESQRQMFENGGYGGNDRSTNDEGPGVTDEAKEKWKSYEWGDIDAEETAKLAGLTRTASMEAIKRTMSAESNYGSVSTVDILEDEDREERESLQQQSPLPSPSKKLDSDTGGLLSFDDGDEEPSCSICLCEYERGEKVIRLPCDHVYHTSCLESWTDNHVRCPLCNYDLMEGFEQPASVRRASRVAEEQRAFRSMALSTLGRRIRTRRRASRNDARRAAERRLVAAAAAAAGDSIV